MYKQELPIAQLSAIYANSQKTKPPYYSPAELCIFTPKEDKIPTVICNTFVNLAETMDLPVWALVLAPVSELESGANNKDIAKPRCWTSHGICLVAPQISAIGLKIGMALTDGNKSGKVTVFDVDSNQSYEIVVPSDLKAGAYLDVVWELIPESEELNERQINEEVSFSY